MLRKIIKINVEKCNGCGLCIPNCPEGAIQIIDSKARLISDLFCDGLGACLGHCPEQAIVVEEREAEEYNEFKVMENIVKQGENVIKAHLIHLKDHNEAELYNQAMEFLSSKKINIKLDEDDESEHLGSHHTGCPGAKMMTFSKKEEKNSDELGKRTSYLQQWPVQFHLVSPLAPYYKGKDLLLSADCVAYSVGDFHKDYLKGKSLAIACPKLDQNKDIYLEKLKIMIDKAEIKSLTVMTMEVPCCQGLLNLAISAVNSTKRKIPVKSLIVGINGEIISDEYVNLDLMISS
jgi:Pyruvate/2-oxoacid:ferredoxin oxidoreductase delta subunit